MVTSQTKLNTVCGRKSLRSITGDCSVFIVLVAARPHRTSLPVFSHRPGLFLVVSHHVSFRRHCAWLKVPSFLKISLYLASELAFKEALLNPRGFSSTEFDVTVIGYIPVSHLFSVFPIPQKAIYFLLKGITNLRKLLI